MSPFRHLPPVLLGLAALLAGFGGPLTYRRAEVLDGAWWQLLSAHLVHAGAVHLLLNLAGLWLVWLLFGRRLGAAAWAWVLFACAVGCGGGLLLFSPGVTWYVGLSGVLHGLFAAGAVAELRQGARRSGALLLGGLVLKLGWEQQFGPAADSAQLIGAAVIVDAHLYGACAGLLAAWPRRVSMAPAAAMGGSQGRVIL